MNGKNVGPLSHDTRCAEGRDARTSFDRYSLTSFEQSREVIFFAISCPRSSPLFVSILPLVNST